MKIDKIDIKTLMIGVIGSLLVIYLFVPSLNTIGNIIFTLSSFVSEKYNTMLYQSIALRHYSLDVYIYLYIFVFYLLLFILSFIYIYFGIKNILEDYNALELKLNETTKNADEIYNELEDIKKSIESGRKDIKKKYIYSNIQILISFILFFIIGLVNLSTEVTIRNKIQLYENSLKIISPYISDNEIQMLESKFVQIKNKNDYELIREKMNNMLIEKGLMIIWQ